MSFLAKAFGKKTLSVHGGAGGNDTRISSSSSSFILGHTPAMGGFDLADGLDLHVGANEKATMQNLNERLASYMEKVHTLEKENQLLEKQIREWYQSKVVVAHDYARYLAIIDDLNNKIYIASRLNVKTILDIDNGKLAADDFKNKGENELSMRMTVEGDIAGLRRVLDDLNIQRLDLENQYESRKDELIMLKRNHEEELALLRSQMGGQVNVAVDASPSPDLNKAMSEIRQHYETVISKNRKELEAWYQKKVADLELDVKVQSENLVTINRQIKELKTTLQRLEIELQSHLSMKASLEGNLAEIKARYSAQLSSLQNTVTCLEAQLSSLHNDIAQHKRDYEMLLDIKTRLQLEIAEYRRLLEGEEDSSRQVIKKVITVVETVVDGRVVETSKTTI